MNFSDWNHHQCCSGHSGSLVGLLVGNRIPEKTRQTLISVMGLYTLAYGVFIFTKTQNMLIPLLSLVMGTIIVSCSN
jgi:uncharacterized membrane protein YqgA involved in biofilm formation